MTTSTFTWMQFDAAQAERAKELVRALSEPTTQDSIGVGPVRDGFADIFFPGTSTLHSRAIYVLVIPWAFQRVADRRPRDAQQYDRWLRAVEVDTINSLVQGNDANENGIIGRAAGAKLKRLPSELYWSGLGVWGVRSQSVGKALTRADVRSMVLDDPQGASARLWDGVPPPPKHFPKDPLAILPTPEQSRYLLDKFGQTPVSPTKPAQPSLLARVSREPHLLHDGPLWEVDSGNDYLATAMRFAHGFATVIQGARLRYLDLLFRDRFAKDPAEPLDKARENLAGSIDEWTARMEAEADFLTAWRSDIPAMFGFLREAGANITEPTRQFLASWCRAATDDPQAAMTSRDLATSIRNREHTLKGSAARLTNASPLLSWKGELLGSDYLDYRWSYAHRLVDDCVQGMAGDDA